MRVKAHLSAFSNIPASGVPTVSSPSILLDANESVLSNLSGVAAVHSDIGLDAIRSFHAFRDVDGFTVMLAGFGFWMIFWLVVFYATLFTHRWWGRLVPPSTKEHENDRLWLTRHIVGIAFSLYIACLTVPAVFQFWNQTPEVKFGHSSNLAFCETNEYGESVRIWAMVVALAGTAFTAYIIVDFATMFIHSYATADYVVHHIVFIATGLIVRWHCMLPYTAAILMAMEASTPFLNICLLYRNRGDVYRTVLMVCGGFFFALFVVSRLFLNTFGAIALLVNRKEFLMPLVPAWQAWTLVFAIVAGVAVQFFWFPQIYKLFGSHLVPMVMGALGREDASKRSGESS